jgi:hypothetical protein
MGVRGNVALVLVSDSSGSNLLRYFLALRGLCGNGRKLRLRPRLFQIEREPGPVPEISSHSRGKVQNPSEGAFFILA